MIKNILLLITLCFSLVVESADNIPELDKDVRCCFTSDQLNDHIVISIKSDSENLAHINVTTPSGERIGVNLQDSLYFHQPNKQGLYAYGPRPNKPIDSKKWDFSKHLFLFRSWKNENGVLLYERLGFPEKYKAKFLHGIYTLKIKAIDDGAYKIVIYTDGISRPEKIISWPKEGLNHIRKHEIQMVKFSVNEEGNINLVLD